MGKKQIKDDIGDAAHTNLTNNRPIEPPKGRWAQRLDATGITVKSVYDSDSVIPFPLQGTYYPLLMKKCSLHNSLTLLCLKCALFCFYHQKKELTRMVPRTVQLIVEQKFVITQISDEKQC